MESDHLESDHLESDHLESDPVADALDDTAPWPGTSSLQRICDSLAEAVQAHSFVILARQSAGQRSGPDAGPGTRAPVTPVATASPTQASTEHPTLVTSRHSPGNGQVPPDGLDGWRERVLASMSDILAAAARAGGETDSTQMHSEGDIALAPVRRNDDTIGAVGISWKHEGTASKAPPSPVLARTARAISLRVSSAHPRSDSRRADHASVLPDVLEELAKVTLDTPSLLRTIVDRAAAIVGDACLLSLVDRDRSTLVRAAFSHPDPEVSDWIAANMLATPVPLDQGLVGEVLRTGETLFVPVADPDDIRRRASPELSRYVATHGIASLIVVPLTFRGEVAGILRLHRDSPGRPYTLIDRAFAEDLAAHAALAISNARLVEALRRSEAELRSVLDQAADAVVLVDEHGVIRSFNGAAERLLGRSSSDVVGRPATEIFVEGADGHPLSGLVGGEHEVVGKRPDGTPYAAALTVSPVDVGEDRVVYTAIARDVTDRKRSERATQHAALHDPLTGLPNRRLLEDRLAQAVARSGRANEPLAVLFVDLDGFKSVNDTHGHEAGDSVLSLVSDRLREAMREEDTLARLGGDEFVGVLEHVDPNGRVAMAIAERLLAAFDTPFSFGGHVVRLGASIGITIGSGTDVTADLLLSQADEAMYEAKRLGRNQSALRLL